MLRRLWDAVGAATEVGIDLLVRLTGRTAGPDTHPWLAVPLGDGDRIGPDYYVRLAAAGRLEVRPQPGDGLLASFAALRGPGFDPDKVHPAIAAFYERTADHRLEAWSDAPVLTRAFLWWLVALVSRRMDQFNFPLSPLDLAGGMTSQVLPLVDPATGERAYTGWLRRSARTGRVVYAGLYAVSRVPAEPGPCVQVSFPVPRGSVLVVLRPEAGADGSLRLVSGGAGFGGTGYYRLVAWGPGRLAARHFRTLKEVFHLYLDPAGVLRTDHEIRFLGLLVVRLHYKIVPAAVQVPNQALQQTVLQSRDRC